MMRKLALVAGLGLVAAASPLLAQTPAARGGDLDPNERVCRRSPPDVSTRIPARRVCKLRKEWAEEARESQGNWQNRHRPPSGNDR